MPELSPSSIPSSDPPGEEIAQDLVTCAIDESCLATLIDLFRPTVVDEVALRVNLARAGFAGPQVAFLNLYRVLRATASQPPRFLESTLRHLLLSADPDMALNNLEHLVQRHYEDRDLPWTFTGEPYRALIHLLGSSQSIADGLIRRPDLVAVLSESSTPPGIDTLFARAREVVRSNRDRTSRIAALKVLREREMLRLAAMDIVHGGDVVAVSRATAQLASALIQGAFEAAALELAGNEKKSEEMLRGFAVIGLGKLGGDELNYSSDVDLIFVQETSDDDGHLGRLARLAVRNLADRDEDGSLLRVDLRLRPEGDTGPIARSLSSTLDYYQRLGRPWERQMLVKARAVAGDLELGAQFIEEVRPFVIGPYLDHAAIQQIKELRRQMEKAVEPDGEDRLEIKRGRGGIRDIEYTVQFLQLLNARSHPSVIHYNTMESLVRLERVKAITREEREALQSAYRFLRRIENRVQLHHRIATHRVPADEVGLNRLARSLGFYGSDVKSDFRARLDHHRSAARRVYTKLLGGLFGKSGEGKSEIYDLILDPTPDDSVVERVLSRFGFRAINTAHTNIKKLGESNSRVLPTSPRAKKFFADVVPRILDAVCDTPDPDQALSNLERFSRSAAGKALFFRLLSDEPTVLDILVDVAGHSQLLSDILIREPENLDPFVDSLLVEKRGHRKRERGLKLRELEESSDWTLALADYKTLETLRIGTRDIQGKADAFETLHSLSRLATTIVKRAWAKVVSQAPKPAWGTAAVMAVGKLGGLEINYGSDLDLIFVVDDDQDPAEASSYWTERARHFIRALTTPGPTGRLYRIDTRLRPEGDSGPLVTTRTGLALYYRSERVHPFELQSMLRLRFVAGCRELGMKVIRDMREVLEGPFDVEKLKEHMIQMRSRIESEGRGLDVKRGRGGLVDIEFITQFLQLTSGNSKARSPNTARALDLLVEAGHLEEGRGRALASTYRALRRLESGLQIVWGLDHESLPTDPEELKKMARRMRPDGGEESLLEDFEKMTRRNRAIFEEIIGAVEPRTSRARVAH